MTLWKQKTMTVMRLTASGRALQSRADGTHVTTAKPAVGMESGDPFRRPWPGRGRDEDERHGTLAAKEVVPCWGWNSLAERPPIGGGVDCLIRV